MQFTREEDGMGSAKPVKRSIAPSKRDPAKIPWQQNPWVLTACLIALTLLAYIPAMNAGTIWDDAGFVFDNAAVSSRRGLHFIWLTKSNADFFPLTLSSLWLEYRLWGPNPIPYHITNILLHACSAVLLWRLLRQLKVPGAYLGAMLFAVHPVNVASVAWITERKNTLSMLFYLLSALYFFRFDENPRHKTYILSLVFFLAALLSKTSAVVLPPILLAIIWWKRRAWTRQDLLRVAPYFVIGIVLGLVTVWFQQRSLTSTDANEMPTLAQRLALPGWVVWFYLGKVLFPWPLLMGYPRWELNTSSLLIYAPLMLLILSLAALFFLRNKSFFITAILYVLALGPVLGLLPMTFHYISWVSDHLQQIALPAPLALIGAGLALLAQRPARHKLAIALFSLLILILTGMTFNHSRHFKNDGTLWKFNNAYNPNCWAGNNNLGIYYVAQGDLAKAKYHYDYALKLRPNYSSTYYNRGLLFSRQGKFKEALADEQIAIRIDPRYWQAFSAQGAIYTNMGQFDRALDRYLKALAIKPTDAAAHNNAGNIFLSRGDIKNALIHLNAATMLNPNYAMAYSNRAVVWFYMGDYAKAWRDLEKGRSLGDTPPPKFIADLKKASGQS